MILYPIEIIGTIAFAVSGALAAIRHRMDISGAIVLGFLVGNGGGTIRDLLLHREIFWIDNQLYVWITISAAFLTFIIAVISPPKYFKKLERPLMYFDAIGLAAFTILGIQIAFSLHHDAIIAIMMGLVTATGGGLLRDVLCHEPPMVFHGTLYATPALLGALLYVFTYRWANPHIAILYSCLFIVIFRVLAIQFKWHAPTIKKNL